MNDDVACSVDNCICEIVSGREEEHESKNTWSVCQPFWSSSWLRSMNCWCLDSADIFSPATLFPIHLWPVPEE
jgi:hypothetical protein